MSTAFTDIPLAAIQTGEFLSNSANTRLRVLVLDEEFPFPPTSGKRIRTWALLSRVAQRHDITILCHGPVAPEALDAAEAFGISIVEAGSLPSDHGALFFARLLANMMSPYPYSVSKHYTSSFRRSLRALLQNETFDLIHCEWTPYARYLRALPPVPKLVTTHNVEWQIWDRRSKVSRSWIERVFFRAQATKMRRFEQRFLREAAEVTAVTAKDATELREMGIPEVSVVENGVDLDCFHPMQSQPQPGRILFLASLDWFPNQDALDYLIEDIMPLVRSNFPSARLCVVGRRAPKRLRASLQCLTWVDFVGEAEDVRPWIASAGVVVVPLRVGGGSRIKILETLAMSRAVVSTTIGAEGLSLEAGRDLEIADTPADFARKVTRLLSDPEQQRRLGANGMATVRTRYGWDKAAGDLQQVWMNCATYLSRR